MADFSNIPKLDWKSVQSIRSEIGDAFYVLDDRRFEVNFKLLLSAFRKHYPKTGIGYSYKTNYTPYLCRRVQALGGYAEVVSEMEYDLARRIGVPSDRIIFNGPYKSERAFAEALNGGAIVNLDNARDLGLLLKLAEHHPDKTFGVALRCNFELNTGSVSRFGFDVDGEAFRHAIETIAQAENAEVVGLHCHFPDRDKSSYSVRTAKILDLSDRVFGDRLPQFLNIGGGFFGEIPESLKSTFSTDHVSFEEYAKVVAAAFSRHFGTGSDCPELIIEPGTAVVANTMRFFSQVLDVKTIRGRAFATVAGSIFNISPVARNLNLPVRVIPSKPTANEDAKVFDIVGYTCIEGDVMSKGVWGTIVAGDFVEYSNIGSYSIVMKPPFILPNFPIIRFEDASDPGTWILVKKAETADYIFENFVDYQNGR